MISHSKSNSPSNNFESLKNANSRVKLLFVSTLFSFFFLPIVCVGALTPIARVDVVPYQRINAGDSFNFGVVAFSKEGIDRVEFSISGGGYSGGTKTASSMTLNSRTDVWEYWVTFSGFEFSTDEAITVTSTVYGGEGDTRVLTTPVLANPNGTLAQYEAWVDATNGNNSTGTVGNSSAPYLTIAGAASAVVAANGGSGDGATIYLEEGSYSVAGLSPNASGEWLTIARAEGAAKANTIINAGTVTVDMVHLQGITVQRVGSIMFAWNASNRIWVDNVESIGSGIWVSTSYPIACGYEYYTDSEIHDLDYGPRDVKIARNVHVYHFGNDAFFNGEFIVNTLIEDQDNGVTGWHSDGYQMETIQNKNGNRILYNIKMLNMHVQSIYMQTSAGMMNGLAVVNVHTEQREPAMPNESGRYTQSNVGINNGDGWDHVLMWNSSFPYSHSAISGNYITNGSIVGNLFWDMAISDSSLGTPNVPWAENGNSNNNEVLHNHYINVYNETPTCTQPSVDIQNGHPCPHWYAKRPDSGVTLTASMGDPLIESALNPVPQVGSILLDRFASRVPVDINGNGRGAVSDVGAYELNGYQTILKPEGFSLAVE